MKKIKWDSTDDLEGIVVRRFEFISSEDEKDFWKDGLIDRYIHERKITWEEYQTNHSIFNDGFSTCITDNLNIEELKRILYSTQDYHYSLEKNEPENHEKGWIKFYGTCDHSNYEIDKRLLEEELEREVNFKLLCDELNKKGLSYQDSAHNNFLSWYKNVYTLDVFPEEEDYEVFLECPEDYLMDNLNMNGIKKVFLLIGYYEDYIQEKEEYLKKRLEEKEEFKPQSQNQGGQ